MSTEPDVGAALARNTVWFGRLLHRAGLSADPPRTRLFLHALLQLGLHRKADIKAAGRAIFVQRREERATYDTAFEIFWRRRGDDEGIGRTLPRIRQGEHRETGSRGPGGDAGGETVELSRPTPIRSPSEREAIRTADFAGLTPDEARDAQAMLEALRPKLPRRPARRARLGRRG